MVIFSRQRVDFEQPPPVRPCWRQVAGNPFGALQPILRSGFFALVLARGERKSWMITMPQTAPIPATRDEKMRPLITLPDAGSCWASIRPTGFKYLSIIARDSSCRFLNGYFEYAKDGALVAIWRL